MINFRFIANLMGRLLLIESAFLLLCVLIALIYGEHDASAFFYTSLITMSAGFLLSKLIKIKDRVLAKKDGYFMVTMVWIIFSLPLLFFLLSSCLRISFMMRTCSKKRPERIPASPARLPAMDKS